MSPQHACCRSSPSNNMSPTTLSEMVLETEDEIRDLAIRHRVCYEWSNHYEMNDDIRLATGFSLRLYGANCQTMAGDPASKHPVPGCPACRNTYRDLLRIAHWVMPKDSRESWYKIEPFDSAFHVTPKRNWREEIVLGIQILHRDERGRPKDECEARCLHEMCAKLRLAGVLEGRVNREFGKHAARSSGSSESGV